MRWHEGRGLYAGGMTGKASHLVGHPARVLGIIACALLFSNTLVSRLDGQMRWLAVALLLIITIAVLFHPRWGDASIAVVAVCLAICLGFTDLRQSFEVVVPVLYVSYVASAYSPPTWRRLWLSLLLVGVGSAMFTAVFRVPVEGGLLGGMAGVPKVAVAIVATAGTWIVLGFFWLLGRRTRDRSRDIAVLQERAEMAQVMERTRIAREMHDIVAHSLSGIMALSDGARFAAKKDPDVAVETLEVISAQSREALGHMRGLLTVLRTDSSRAALAAPGIADLRALIAETTRAGQEISVRGLDEAVNSAEMGELAQFTVYRVVQEMLSNILRHADGPATMEFEATSRRLRIVASNPSQPSPVEGTPGYGLMGMTERVRALGGVVRVQETADHFTVAVEVPW